MSWPTRKETIQTTAIVFAFVVVMALFLFSVDTTLAWIVQAADGAEAKDERDKKWYVVHAYSGFEKSVQRALTERIQRSDMPDQFGQILVPVEEVVEMKARAEGDLRAQVLPGLRAGRDGDDRRHAGTS